MRFKCPFKKEMYHVYPHLQKTFVTKRRQFMLEKMSTGDLDSACSNDTAFPCDSY